MNEIDVIEERDAEWADGYQKELSRGVTQGGSADDAGEGVGQRIDLLYNMHNAHFFNPSTSQAIQM